MRRRTSAICLRCGDYSETSQVVGFLTRDDGRVDLLAKGAKRAKGPTGGAIDVLAEGELVYIPPSRQGLGTLVEFTESASRGVLRRDARRLNTALLMLELVAALLAEADPHPEVYDLLHNALDRLAGLRRAQSSRADSKPGAVLAYFQWRLLRHVGLLGELRRCTSCGREISGAGRKDVYFSSSQGGLLCGACEGAAAGGEKFRLDGAALAALAALAAAEAGQRVTLPDAQAAAVNRLLVYHVTYQLGRGLKMARHAIDGLEFTPDRANSRGGETI